MQKNTNKLWSWMGVLWMVLWSVGLAQGALVDGLQSYWGFEDGSGITLTDAMNKNDGTLVNGPVWSTGGKQGGCLTFDGYNDYVQVLNPDVPVGGSVRTIAGWFNQDVAGGDRVFLTYGQRVLHELVSMELIWGGIHFASHSDDVHKDGYPTAGTWHLYATTFNGTTVTVYMDNVCVGSRDIPLNTINYDAGLLIGAHVEVPGNNNYFWHWNGKIDEVGIWNRALNTEELSALWNNGSGVTLVPVPEPATLSLLALALGGLSLTRRGRRGARQ